MRAHKIENGVVVNTIEVESLDFMPGLIDAGPGGSIGDHYENGVFTTPVVAPAPEPVAPTKEQLLAQLNSIQAQIQAL
jgi:hypothetical protein